MTLSEKTQSIQRYLGITADGIYGPQTADAILAKLGIPVGPSKESLVPFQVDARSAQNIQTLLPEVQPLAERLVTLAAEKGITIKVISGNRTYEEQDALYAKGRTTGGQKVTNARGGQSNHNFGIAFDIGVFSPSGAYVEEGPAYREVGKLGKSLGLVWGGDWKTIVDEPHFEFNPNGYTLAELRSRKERGLTLV